MVSLTKNRDVDMLHGPLLRKLLQFILPLMITNLLQTCYSAADMIVVGMSNVQGAIGSIGTTGAMLNLIINVFIGFSVGANVVVARSIGAGDRDGVSKAVHTSLCMSVLFGLLGCAVGLAICRPALVLLGDEGGVLELATLYSRIYICGIPFLSGTNCLIAIFRAKGDTKTPLYVLTATGILNVGLNVFFVLALKMSVDGVAIATTVSNAASMLVLLLLLARDTGLCKFSPAKLRITGKAFRDILYIGLPAGLQGALFSISNMLIQSSIIGLNNSICPGGSDVIDGNSAAMNLETFASAATNAGYQACVSFTAQHVGAGKHKRMKLVLRDCYLVTALISAMYATVLLVFRVPLSHLYIHNELAESVLRTRFMFMITMHPLLALMEVGSGVQRGYGRSITSAVVTLLGSCVFRVLWILTVFRAIPTIQVIYMSYPISWGLTALAHYICICFTRRNYPKEDAPDNVAC